MRPFSGVAGSKQAPTDALRLVGAISLTAVVGGTPSPSRFGWILVAPVIEHDGNF